MTDQQVTDVLPTDQDSVAKITGVGQQEKVDSLGSYLDNYVINTVGSLNSLVNNTTFSSEASHAELMLQTVGVQAVAQGAVDNAKNDELEGFVELLQSTPEINDVDGQEGVAEILATGEVVAQQPYAVNYFLTKYLNQGVEEETALNLAAFDYSKALVAKAFDEIGLLDTVIDYGALFLVPGLEAYDNSQVEEFLGTSVEEFSERFMQLPTEQRVELMPALVAGVLEATDNQATAQLVIQALLGVAGSQEDLELSVGLSLADFGLTALAGAGAVVKGLKAINRSRSLAGVNTAAEIAVDAMDSGVPAKLLNSGEFDIPSSASPLRFTEDFFDGVTDDVRTQVGNVLDRRLTEIQRQAASVRIEEQGVLVGDNKEVLLDAFRKKYLDHLEIEDIQLDIKGNKIVGSAKGRGGYIGATRIEAELSNKDIGSWDATVTSGAVANVLASPLFTLRNLAKADVERGIFLQDIVTQGNRARLNQSVEAAFKGLNKKSKGKVDEVLLAGDQHRWADHTQGKVYSLKELLEGVETRTGVVKLSPDEASSYYAARQVYDNLFWMKNDTERAKKIASGFKNSVRLTGDGRVLDETISELSEYASVKQLERAEDDVEFVWDAVNGRRITLKELEDGVSTGKGNLYKSDEKVRLVRGDGTEEYYDHLFVPDSALDDLPRQVMNYQQGYVTRIRPDAHWVVKSQRSAVVNGKVVQGANRQTEWLLDNKTDADKIVEQLRAENADTDATFEVVLARTLDDTARDELDIQANFGGLYTGARSQRQIPFNLDGGDANRLSAIESMERMASNVARVTAMNTYRLQAVQKFTNTYGHLLEDATKWRSKFKADTPPSVKATGEQMQRFVELMSGLPTKQSRQFENAMQGAAMFLERFETTKSGRLSKLRNGIMRMSVDDPFMYARSTAFHALLGMGNPAQLLVQATGSALAFAIHPERWVKSNQQYLGLRTAFQRLETGKDNLEKLIPDSAAKAAGFTDKQEMIDVSRKLFKTGVWSSLRSNADYAAVSQGMPVDAGAFRRLFGNIREKGLIFYREGEGYNRLYAVSNAYQDWKKKNPGRLFTQEAADRVVKNSNRYTLHMSSANKAAWQEGMLSIPTQFLQVHTKYLEALLGNEFTKAQKARMVVGQGVLFGAAGVPFVPDSLAKAAIDVWTNDDPTSLELDDRALATVTGGLVGVLTNELVGNGGLDVTRFSLPSGLSDIVDSVYNGEIDINTLVGASGAIGTRVYDAAVFAFRTAGTPMSEMTSVDAVSVADKFFDVVSTWNNASKAYIWHQTGVARGKNGEELFPADYRATIARAVGFTTWREKRLWTNSEYLYAKSQARKDITNFLSTKLVEYASADRTADQQEVYARLFGLAAGLTGSPTEAADVMKAAIRRAYPNESKEARQFKQILRQQGVSGNTEDAPLGGVTGVTLNREGQE